MKKTFIFLLWVLCGVSGIGAQNLFPEVLSGCNTDRFSLESEVETVPTDIPLLKAVLTKALGKKNLANSRGELRLQIIVNQSGESCLLSFDNRTNGLINKIKLQAAINKKLKWDPPRKKISALIFVLFDAGITDIKRIGVNGKLGFHELKRIPGR